MFCIVSDDDGHNYVIPADKEEEFHSTIEAIGTYWANLEDDDDPPELPEWADSVNGSESLVQFPSYRIR